MKGMETFLGSHLAAWWTLGSEFVKKQKLLDLVEETARLTGCDVERLWAAARLLSGRSRTLPEHPEFKGRSAGWSIWPEMIVREILKKAFGED